jgi:exodeoxyribonuclease VIII
MKPGIYPNLSNEEYHGHKESISRSALMDFQISPFTYWAKHLNPARPQKDATRQMILGSAFHTLILEEDLFAKNYMSYPPKVLLKDVGREKYDEYKKLCETLESLIPNYPNLIILSNDEKQTLFAMQERIEANEQAIELIKDARIEHSYFWIDKDSGLLLKARPDALHANMIVDLKTCNDASPRAIQNAMITGGYHIQGAMIRDAVEAIEGNRINTVINLCVETKYPHNMGIYILDEFAIDEGEKKYKQICLDLKTALETNSFCDYGIQTIGLPKWAMM